MNIIVCSKKEGFEAGARKLKEESFQYGKICKIVEVEDFVDLMAEEYFESERALIYFLSSDYRIPLFINRIKQKNQVVNEAFLMRDILMSKFESLERSQLAGVSVPKHALLTIDNSDFTDKFAVPVFIKSKSPRGLVTRIDDKKSFIDKLQTLADRSNYYLEENVKHKDNIELKFYYIDGAVYTQRISNTNTNIPNWFCFVLNQISKCTELDVFSVDCLVDWDKRKYYCFDINHASSFYKSDDARKTFITRILK